MLFGLETLFCVVVVALVLVVEALFEAAAGLDDAFSKLGLFTFMLDSSLEPSRRCADDESLLCSKRFGDGDVPPASSSITSVFSSSGSCMELSQASVLAACRALSFVVVEPGLILSII